MKLTLKYINELQTWRDAGDRNVEIAMGRDGTVSVWCYDYELSDGIRITPPALPDLNAISEARERAEYERLRAKYGN